MEETFFFCQECDGKITLDQLGLLNEGKCPKCGSLAGFSTQSKTEADGFEHLTMINDAQLLEKTLKDS
jgi:transcription initiation factor IIE alpha subunit